MNSPFDYLKSINETKEDLIVDAQTEKDYNAWIVNVGLSMFIDTALYANEMNMLAGLDSKLQYDYFLHSIKKRKRYSKWHKNKKDQDIEVIRKMYGYNIQKAKAALTLLSEEQIKQIHENSKNFI